MDEKETESTGLERLCQAISPGDAACTYPAAVHWATCGRWFCDAAPGSIATPLQGFTLVGPRVQSDPIRRFSPD
jgi:hypothetical protein